MRSSPDATLTRLFMPTKYARIVGRIRRLRRIRRLCADA
ncbi:mannitol-1-phosphate 5-dehydrogenase [Escherichia coli]|nr:mannitol-1-phosphate 5-dehydrogenase [Escherichia coli]OOH64676.1 mannitol-1-phosphate 5-dehydrogenase [Escherichia coli]